MTELKEGYVFQYRPYPNRDEPYCDEYRIFSILGGPPERHKVLSITDTEIRTTRVDVEAISDKREYSWPTDTDTSNDRIELVPP